VRSPHRRQLAVIAVIGVAAAFLASCSGQQSEKSSSNSAAIPDSSASRVGAPPAAGPASNSSPPAANLAVAKRPGGDRQVISTAQLQLEARDIDQTVQRATALVLGAQGYVFSESASLADNQQANVVFKVVPARFNDVVRGLGGLGKLVHQQIGTQDVTGQVVDLGARLTAAQTSAARLQQLLAGSGSVADLLGVEQQLTTRDGEVDSLSGELAALRAQVDLATITLDVSALPAHPRPAPHHARPGFARGLHAGRAAFADTARVVEAAVGLALPFVPVALLALAGWWILRRRTAATPPAG
jgi:hypothetical protein